MVRVTIHGISQRQFLDVKQRILTVHGGAEMEPGTVEREGVRCAYEYNPDTQSLEVVVQMTPQIITPGYVIGWLCDTLAQAPA